MVEEEGGIRLSKRYTDQGGEVDNKTKSGTAWSHNFLNQKPWHPLSYPNQRRKWIAEQTNAQHERRAEEVAREFAQEQEFFRQTALVSKKEKEKVELMKAVSFMYVRPPGYNAESAKAAEIADEGKLQDNNDPSQDHASEGPSNPVPTQSKDQAVAEKKKPRPKDVFGRALPTEEEFDVLKNAPKHETGIAGRAKPFGVEVRNVKCLRCGTFGHQSGDRECSLKDVITSNEESRLKRDDPLTAILAHTEGGEPLKWELKQKPGISPPRGGFKHDDPNQQIVAEDIFDEYGGFLSGGNIPELLMDFNPSLLKKRKSTSKSKHKRHSSPIHDVRGHEENRSYSDGNDDRERRLKRREKKHHKKRRNHSDEDSDSNNDDKREKWSTSKEENNKKKRRNHSNYDDSESGSFSDGVGRERRSNRRVEKYKKKKRYYFNDDSESESYEDRGRWLMRPEKYKKKEQYYPDDDLEDGYVDDVRVGRSKGKENKHQTKKRNYSDEDSERESRPPIKYKQKRSHYYSRASKYTVDDDGHYKSKNHNQDHHPSRSRNY